MSLFGTRKAFPVCPCLCRSCFAGTKGNASRDSGIGAALPCRTILAFLDGRVDPVGSGSGSSAGFLFSPALGMANELCFRRIGVNYRA